MEVFVKMIVLLKLKANTYKMKESLNNIVLYM